MTTLALLVSILVSQPTTVHTTLDRPSMQLQRPDWAFILTARQEAEPLPPADRILSALDRKDCPFDDLPEAQPNPFEPGPDPWEFLDPAAEAREAIAVFQLNEVLGQLDGLVRP